MKLTVLCDNATYIDQYYLAEPALSFFIEDEGRRILFDTGYSDVFIKNAEKMNIPLKETEMIVLSHGHNDHTGGLAYLEGLDKNTVLLCHPETGKDREYEGLDISMPVKVSELSGKYTVVEERKPRRLTEKLWYLGEIERRWQHVEPLEDDELHDDTALVYDGEEGLLIITGCSHSGIINICEHARKVTGKKTIRGVIGGFHILNNDRLAQEVSEYFSRNVEGVIYPCHCTDLQAKIVLSRRNRIVEVATGFVLEIE